MRLRCAACRDRWRARAAAPGAPIDPDLDGTIGGACGSSRVGRIGVTRADGASGHQIPACEPSIGSRHGHRQFLRSVQRRRCEYELARHRLSPLSDPALEGAQLPVRGDAGSSCWRRSKRSLPMRSGSASSQVRTTGQVVSNGSLRVRQSCAARGTSRCVARTSPCCHAVASPTGIRRGCCPGAVRGAKFGRRPDRPSRAGPIESPPSAVTGRAARRPRVTAPSSRRSPSATPAAFE